MFLVTDSIRPPHDSITPDHPAWQRLRDATLIILHDRMRNGGLIDLPTFMGALRCVFPSSQYHLTYRHCSQLLIDSLNDLNIMPVSVRLTCVDQLRTWYVEKNPTGLVAITFWTLQPVIYASDIDTSVLIKMTF